MKKNDAIFGLAADIETKKTPTQEELYNLIAEHTEELINTLFNIAIDKNEKPRIRLQAISILIKKTSSSRVKKILEKAFNNLNDLIHPNQLKQLKKI